MKLSNLLFVSGMLSVGASGQETNDLTTLRQGVIDVETDLTKESLATGRAPALFYSPERRFDFPIAVKRDDLDHFLKLMQPDGSVTGVSPIF